MLERITTAAGWPVIDRHAAAQRNLFNRFLGCLYYCLQAGQTYSETAAFPRADVLAA